VRLDPLTVAIVAVIAYLVLKRLIGGGRVAASIVKEKIDGGARIVDVRSPAEFQDGAYPGAINIPLPDIQRRLGELPKDKAVIVYCASGARSAMAARAIRQAGFTDVINAGGLRDMPR
jgi:phage shock protein E